MAEAEPSILLVDDEAEDLALLKKALSSIGCSIHTVSDPHEVLPAVHRETPGVVVMDALLPGLSGFDLCKQIKTDEKLKGTKVIIITGVYLRQQYRQEALQQFKADGFLTKPFRPPELQELVVELLAKKTRGRESRFRGRLGRSSRARPKKRGFLERLFGKEEEAPPSIAPVARRRPPRPSPAPEPSEEATSSPEDTEAGKKASGSEPVVGAEPVATEAGPEKTPESTTATTPETAEKVEAVAGTEKPETAQKLEEPGKAEQVGATEEAAKSGESESADESAKADEAAETEESAVPAKAIEPEKPEEASQAEAVVEPEEAVAPEDTAAAGLSASEPVVTTPPSDSAPGLHAREGLVTAAVPDRPAAAALDTPPSPDADEGIEWTDAPAPVPEEAPRAPAEPGAASAPSRRVRRPELRVGDVPVYKEDDFRTELKRELSKCRRVDRPLTLILIQVEDLPQIVEIFGTEIREAVLWHVAEQAMASLREVDLVGMISTEDLIALAAFASDKYGGGRVVSRMRRALDKNPFRVSEELPSIVPVVLFGMASYPEDGDDAGLLMAKAKEDITVS